MQVHVWYWYDPESVEVYACFLECSADHDEAFACGEGVVAFVAVLRAADNNDEFVNTFKRIFYGV